MSRDTFQNIMINVYKIKSITVKVCAKIQMCYINTIKTTHCRNCVLHWNSCRQFYGMIEILVCPLIVIVVF